MKEVDDLEVGIALFEDYYEDGIRITIKNREFSCQQRFSVDEAEVIKDWLNEKFKEDEK